MSDAERPPTPLPGEVPSQRVLPAQSLPIAGRHWSDTVLSISAIVIAAISLWVAIETEITDRQTLDQASWPFLQVVTSGGSEGQNTLSLNIQNAGIGPAKIETFELFWRGKPYRSATSLMAACCGYATSAAASNMSGQELGTSEAPGTVLRAGDTLTVIRYMLSSHNAAIWRAFSTQRLKLAYRVCYCSVFNECWLMGTLLIGGTGNLNPRTVNVCPKPAVPYME